MAETGIFPGKEQSGEGQEPQRPIHPDGLRPRENVVQKVLGGFTQLPERFNRWIANYLAIHETDRELSEAERKRRNLLTLLLTGAVHATQQTEASTKHIEAVQMYRANWERYKQRPWLIRSNKEEVVHLEKSDRDWYTGQCDDFIGINPVLRSSKQTQLPDAGPDAGPDTGANLRGIEYLSINNAKTEEEIFTENPGSVLKNARDWRVIGDRIDIAIVNKTELQQSVEEMDPTLTISGGGNGDQNIVAYKDVPHGTFRKRPVMITKEIILAEVGNRNNLSKKEEREAIMDYLIRNTTLYADETVFKAVVSALDDGKLVFYNNIGSPYRDHSALLVEPPVIGVPLWNKGR